MMRGAKRAAMAAAALLALAPLRAAAEERTASLTEAKQAYANVDYERTRELAAQALRQGGNDRRSTAELYWLWGTAAAALERSDEAVRAFVHALAPNPELRLDRSLSPKIRAPYLEARGSLGGAGVQPALSVALERRGGGLEMTLRDSAGIAASIELGTLQPGSRTFVRRILRALPLQTLAKPGGAELSFFVNVVDSWGNVLLELGTPSQPRRLAIADFHSHVAPPRARVDAGRSRLPYYLVAGTLTTLGLAAGGVATAMYLRREDAAGDWNGEACERPGLTRAQQCADVDDRRERYQTLSLGFAAASGALVTGAAISLLLSPRDGGQATVAAGPSALMLRWRQDL